MTKDDFRHPMAVAVAAAIDILKPPGEIFLTFCDEAQMVKDKQGDATAYTEIISMQGMARIVVQYPKDMALLEYQECRAECFDTAFHEVLHIIMQPIIDCTIDETKIQKEGVELLEERPAYLIGTLAGFAFRQIPASESDRVYPVVEFDSAWGK